jgi:hypothetical protein
LLGEMVLVLGHATDHTRERHGAAAGEGSRRIRVAARLGYVVEVIFSQVKPYVLMSEAELCKTVGSATYVIV